jgi:glutamate dehydrogenase (NAD(P)+)
MTQGFRECINPLDLDVDARVLEKIKQTKREVIVHFPVQMDGGAVQVMAGYRMQQNDTKGSFNGGIRYRSDVDLDAMWAMARLMTWGRRRLETSPSAVR